MSYRKQARTITLTVVAPEDGLLGQLRVTGLNGETTWALKLSDWSNVLGTALHAVSDELKRALDEINEK